MAEESIAIPNDIEVSLNGSIITMSGPKGTLTKDFSHTGVKITKTEDKIIVRMEGKGRKPKTMVSTVSAHIRNMIKGVKEGHVYKMKIVYAHFPINIKIIGNEIYIENFMGERSKRIAKIIGDTKVKVSGDEIIIEGIDKEAVGQTAANIHLVTHIKDRDPRVFQDGIYIVEKR